MQLKQLILLLKRLPRLFNYLMSLALKGSQRKPMDFLRGGRVMTISTTRCHFDLVLQLEVAEKFK
jgi:hypothetical protein